MRAIAPGERVAFSRVIGPTWLTWVVAGLVRIPIKRIEVDQVVRAEVEDLDPHRWGGWGYRILPGRSALVLRSGPALVVTTAGQRRFAATIDDPATPAALLNGLAAARQPT